jgi:hypothetical protein
MRAFTLGLLLLAACDDSSNAVKEPTPDSGTVDSGGPIDSGTPTDAGSDAASDCVMNPKTHAEIINACTNATKITKNPVLTKLLPDGGLPPLN